MRVVLLVGHSSYGALPAFTAELAEALAERGHRTIVVDLTQPYRPLEFIAAEEPTDFVFSFNILGDFRNTEGRTIPEIFGAPHLIHFVDHPLTHLKRLEATPPQTAVLTIDPSHAEAVRSLFGEDRFGYVGFVPHGAVGRPVAEPDVANFIENRPIPVLFTGSFYKPGPPPWASLRREIGALIEDAVERALAVEWAPALSVFDEALRSRGLDPSDPGVAPIRKLSAFVHEHVRSRRRFELLKAAAKVGLPLHVYGSGYDKDLYRFRNVTFGGEASFAQTLELMRRSRLVLNVNANFGAGSHERPLTAMLAGAAAATDHSSFYEQAFEPGRSLAVYRWMSLEADLARVAELPFNPSAVFELARAGHAQAVASHRWSHRVEAILAAAEAARKS